jgi:hypothetical protein
MTMNKILLAMALGFSCLAVQASDMTVSLAGKWRIELDRGDVGSTQRWFERTLPDNVKLPGSLPAQGIGDPVSTNTPWVASLSRSWMKEPQYAKYIQTDHFKFPFWLQPDRYYAGPAWYQREISVPSHWQGQRIVLFLERPHWETRVWVDDKDMGSNNSLATPHEYDLGQLAPGKHILRIRVDNRMVIDVGENSHCVSDHTQGNWNGIVGRIELRATPRVWIDQVRVYPDVAKRAVRVVVVTTNATQQPFQGKLTLSFERDGKSNRPPTSRNFNTAAADLTTEDEIELGADAPLWDEFSPVLQTVRAHVRGELAGQSIEHECAVTYGLREIGTKGTQFTMNGRKTFLRGTLECCIFPKTGHPPTEPGEWRRIIRIAKAHGLNLLRFHSYCPPEAAFTAADELGMYFQIETCWANQSTTLGDGQPVDQWVRDETERVLKAYGNHPSFILMSYGNEPGGVNAKLGKRGVNDYQAAFYSYLAAYLEHFKKEDPRHLWTSASGWPQLPENQFHVMADPRIQAWGAGLKSRINAEPPETVTDYRDYVAERNVPVISHEIGQWCVYPNFDEIPKYTGYLKPKNFEIFRDSLQQHGMDNLARQFLLASGKLQTLCYKEDIESALRTPGMGGFELLDLHDFPGQGTALVGVVDPFWEDKGYVTAKEYSRFCNHTVPLARLSKRVFTTEEKLEARLEVAHFGPARLRGAVPTWKLVTESGAVYASGELSPRDVPVDNGILLGSVSVDLARVKAPAHCRLVVALAKTGFENDWDLWVYPPGPASPPPADVLVTSQFDDAAQARLRAGGKVLLTVPGKQVRNFDSTRVALGFSSIFWNTAWTQRQAPTTLGILCDPKHPALAEFPTENHSNWQWWYLVRQAGALRLDLLPHGLQPIVRVIDDWFTARPLALVLEGKVGAGKIVVCGFDLTDNTLDPVSRQMRASLIDYMASKNFQPAGELTLDQVRNLVLKRNQPNDREATNHL